MKREIKIQGVTAVSGVPKKLSSTSGGRLMKGEKYYVIGYVTVPATKDVKGKVTFNSWDGVLIERVATGSQIVVGVNTLLGQSIVFVGKQEGASAKGYKTFTVRQNCFNSVNDFAAKNDKEDNGTIFIVSDYQELPVNAEFKPIEITLESNDTDIERYAATKEKQFYINSLVVETTE